jgi:glycosyltransferase involved in cell wall biosynthesis
MRAEDLDIFILTYNRAGLLEETLLSILGQTAKGSRIVVVDNFSTDNTPDVVLKYRVENVRNAKNIGHENNFKKVKELARADWVMVFHDDDLMHPEYVERVIKVINAVEGVVLLGSLMSFDAKPAIDKWPEVKGRSFIGGTPKELAAKLYDGIPLHFGSVVYKKEMFLTAKIEDDVYGKVFDRPFVLSVASKGKAAIFLDKLIKYRVHSSQDSQDCNRNMHMINIAALNRCYRELLGDSLLTKSGRAFLKNNYVNMYNEQRTTFNEISLDEYVDYMIKHNAATKKSILIGRFLLPVHLFIKRSKQLAKVVIRYLLCANRKKTDVR